MGDLERPLQALAFHLRPLASKEKDEDGKGTVPRGPRVSLILIAADNRRSSKALHRKEVTPQEVGDGFFYCRTLFL